MKEDNNLTPQIKEDIQDLQQAVNEMATNAERIKVITEALLSMFAK